MSWPDIINPRPLWRPDFALHRVAWPTSPAPFPPVSVDEALAYARITHDAEYDVAEGVLRSAIEYAETATRRSVTLTLWDLVLDAFPSGGIILKRPPVLDVVSMQYRDSTNAWVAMDLEDDVAIEIDGDSARIEPVFGGSWPSPIGNPRSVRVRYRAGYRPEHALEGVPLAVEIPYLLKTAILELFAFRFDTRGIGSTNRLIDVGVPANIESALWSERVDL